MADEDEKGAIPPRIPSPKGGTPRPFSLPSFDEEGGALGKEREMSEEEKQRHAFDMLKLPTAKGDFKEAFEEDLLKSSSEFSNMRFVRETTLITDANAYAENIREEADLYARLLRNETERFRQESKAAHADALATLETAEERAHDIQQRAQEEAEAIRKKSEKSGYEKGYAKGVQKRYEEAAPLIERVAEILNQMENVRNQVQLQAETTGVRLALLLAAQVVEHEIQTQPDAIQQLLQKNLRLLADNGKYTVHLHPEDYTFFTSGNIDLQKYISDSTQLTLVKSENVSHGSVLIESDSEVVDLTLDSQFHLLEETLGLQLAQRESNLMRSHPPENVLAAVAALQQAQGGDPNTLPKTPVEDAPSDARAATTGGKSPHAGIQVENLEENGAAQAALEAGDLPKKTPVAAENTDSFEGRRRTKKIIEEPPAVSNVLKADDGRPLV